jgi:hypothetical protein
MIFSQFFSPNHKSSDPEKRIASIEKLNKDAKKDKGILHELAFNDDNDVVSLAALKKLDSFVLWMKSAEASASLHIKKQAMQVCIAQLEDEKIVSDKLLLAFISESKNKPLLEQLLFSSERLQRQDTLALNTLFSLNNANHIRRFYQEHASVSQQILIVDKTQDVKTLSKMNKYAKDARVASAISDKVTNMALMAEKPLKIAQQVSMINSRLLALKDAQNYEYLHRQLAQLSREFESLQPDIECLGDVAQCSLNEKYESLKALVVSKLASLEEAHRETQALEQITAELIDLQERCKQVQMQIEALTRQQPHAHKTVENNAINPPDNTADNVQAFVTILSTTLEDVAKTISVIDQKAHTQTHIQQLAGLRSFVEHLQAQLANVFDIFEFAYKAKLINEALAQLFSDHEKQSESLIPQAEIVVLKEKINVQKAVFAQLKEDAKGLLPSRVSKEFSQTLSTVNALVKQLNDHYKQIEHKCENKLKVVERMITQGKFKPAMAMFHNVQNLYERVAANAPVRLQKLFDHTSAQINKLQEWQAYIAQPRKPALLKQAEALAGSIFEDPYERSHSVKILRQEWNSLGHLHTPEDEVDNKAFDAFIEKSFVPCRVFFAELERQRELNYQKALGLIQEAKSLDNELPAPDLASKTGALKAQFTKLGELEKSQISKVRRDFTKALKPLVAIITSAQQQCAQQKQGLINQAKKIADESTEEAQLSQGVEQAKLMQQKWQQIGFAGKNVDNALWQAFRQANDELFNRFHKHMNAKKDASQAQCKGIDKEISQLISRVKAAKNSAELQFYQSEYTALEEKAKASDAQSLKKLQPHLRKANDIYAQANERLNKQHSTSALNDLFAFLQSYNTSELPDEHEYLLGRHKSWVKGDVPKVDLLADLDRLALTQVAAILIDVPYANVPVGDEATRQNLQLQMMAAKLQGDSAIEPETVLAIWVSRGPIQNIEQDSLQAMKKLFTR